MDNKQSGNIIKSLRIEKGFTQKDLAQKLNVSDKTVSKWERGAGLPDVSILPALAQILETTTEKIISGKIVENDFAGGNMKNTKYYVCPVCHNITLSTGESEIYCCSKKLLPLEMQKATEDQMLNVEIVDGQMYITSNHPMEKDHYISFVAFSDSDNISIYKQYPQWPINLYMPKKRRGFLIWYCTNHGLYCQKI